MEEVRSTVRITGASVVTTQDHELEITVALTIS